MKNPVLIRNFFVFTVLLIICMASLGYHVYRSSETIRISDIEVTHTQRVIREVQQVINAITDVINQQRKIVASNQGSREAYTNSKAVLTTKIAIVRDLSQEDSIQTSRITEVEHLSLKLKDELDRTVALFAEPGIMPSLTDYDETLRVRDDMLKLLNNILNEEYQFLTAREKQVTKTIENYKVTLLIGGIVACLIILLFNWYLLKAQLEVSRAEINLRESEERLRLAIRGSNDGIFDWNFKTKEIYWSKQYKQILGYDEDEIVGNEENFRKLLHPDDAAAFWESFNIYISGRMSEFSSIFRMIHKSGRDVWIHGRGKAIFDENGHAQRFIGAHTDITYMKEHERQLKEERDRAEAASVAKGEFLAHMSHEIRTPLTAVSGIAEILNQAPDGFTDTQKKLIKTLKTSTETLKELITDILDFSKIESGEIELYHQKFTLGELFEQVVSIMSVKANEKMLDFDVDYSEVKNTVFNGDRQRIRQILINLIGNAIKFTEHGHVRVRAAIEPAGKTHVLKVEIEDTGIGIPQSALPVIFEKFRQADSSVSRRYGGTGLGLPISKSLAQIMGGTINVSSEVGKGSAFALVLPFMNNVNEMNIDISEIVRIQKLNDRLKTAVGNKKKILLVEDYEGNVVVLSYILGAMNCAFDVARTGLEALQAWKKNHYDLILMDIQMPEMDGLTATRTIRKMEEEQGVPETPIIGLTAHALVADKQKCIESGMNAYLSKPIVEADLKLKILEFLDTDDDVSQEKPGAREAGRIS